ncbi:hypothetical protein FPOAC2_10593 [Fusarium poae]
MFSQILDRSKSLMQGCASSTLVSTLSHVAIFAATAGVGKASSLTAETVSPIVSKHLIAVANKMFDHRTSVVAASKDKDQDRKLSYIGGLNKQTISRQTGEEWFALIQQRYKKRLQE